MGCLTVRLPTVKVPLTTRPLVFYRSVEDSRSSHQGVITGRRLGVRQWCGTCTLVGHRGSVDRVTQKGVLEIVPRGP